MEEEKCKFNKDQLVYFTLQGIKDGELMVASIPKKCFELNTVYVIKDIGFSTGGWCILVEGSTQFINEKYFLNTKTENMVQENINLKNVELTFGLSVLIKPKENYKPIFRQENIGNIIYKEPCLLHGKVIKRQYVRGKDDFKVNVEGQLHGGSFWFFEKQLFKNYNVNII